MPEHDDFVNNLLSASWRLYKKVKVGGARGEVELEIRMPPFDVLEGVLAEAKALKDGPEGSDVDALAFTRKVIAITVWRPGAVRQLFTPEQVKIWPYASAVQQDCMAAINAATGVESAKGKSEATPT